MGIGFSRMKPSRLWLLLSMAAGEYVSVSSQSDTERADLGRERRELILVPIVSGTSLLFLALLGAWAARTGGAPVLPGSMRVTFWSALAMGLTAAVGAVFGTAV